MRWLAGHQGGAHLPVGQPSKETYLEQLAQHLKNGSYSTSATTKRMAAARQFLLYLQERAIAPEAATVAHEQGFLDCKLKSYCERHGHQANDVSAWRWGYTSGIHMILRLVQGQWPPVSAPATRLEAFHGELCNAC